MSDLRLHDMNIISKEELITLSRVYWEWWRFADGGDRAEREVGRREWVIGVHEIQ
jgi:hypothetical protein